MYVAELTMSGIRGFSGPRAVDLNFSRPDDSYAGWTVIAGRNGSGKSTILQAIALVLAGQNFIRDLDSWSGSQGEPKSSIGVTITLDQDFDGGLNFSPWRLELRWDQREDPHSGPEWIEPSRKRKKASPISPGPGEGWFCAGYGPFRRLSAAALGHSDSRRVSRYAGLRTLFDDDVSLVEGVSWLVEQHLYRLERKPGAADLLDTVLTLLSDGMLPDGHQVVDIDSDGLWVKRNNDRLYPLRQMSDGYRTVTALVVDVIRQMQLAYGTLAITEVNSVPTLAYPGVVLIDEIDAHLHVSWQKKIGDWLKTHFPLVQFIVTSHSPYVCQSADRNGLIRLPGPEDPESPLVVERDLYERVVYGSGDDAILTELFGIDTPYSTRAEEMRHQLGRLESKVLNGFASEAEIRRYTELADTLTSSLAARVDEISSRLGRDK
jgi:energy-coupling factor transporter ATP-binding protein EcfA2